MKILFFAPIAYRDLKQRPQYLAEGLAREHEVIYVDPTVSAMKYLLKGGERPGGYLYPAGKNLTVLRLNGALSAHRSLEVFGNWIAISERLQLKKFLQDADAIWIGYCAWFSLLKGFQGTVIYDKMDDNAEITQNALLRRLIRKTEPQLIQRANVIFVTAQSFLDELTRHGRTAYLVPNAIDQSAALCTEEERPKDSGHRVFGYVGMISHWFDIDAIQTVLNADPCNRVVLVGPQEIKIPAHPRLVCTGRVSKKEVDGWIRSFDVCLYPFRLTSFIDSIDPVKVYEYLAQNKPVLAADSREIQKFGRLVHSYCTQEQLRELAGYELPAPFAKEEQRQKFIQENCWNARLAVIANALRTVDRIKS